MSMTPATADIRQFQIKRAVLALWAAGFLANALYMLADPLSWYDAIAGVPDTGPYNPHFVRDIGVAYLTLGLITGAAALRLRLALPLLCTVALYLGLHALLHLWDVAAGRLEPDHLLIDAPGVFAPVLVTALLAWWVRHDHV